MSKKNSKVRKRLEKIYGKGCFMERAGIRRITGYREDSHEITYHHLRRKSEGGRATEQNGANLALENHEFLHSLSREEEEIINNKIREWKVNFLVMRANGGIENSASLDFSNLTKDKNCVIIELENNTNEQNKKRQKFNRAKIKRETQKLIDELSDEEVLEL